MDADIFELHCQGYTGHSYQLQVRTELDSGSWENLGAPQDGNDAPLRFQIPTDPEQTQYFYRIIVLP